MRTERTVSVHEGAFFPMTQQCAGEFWPFSEHAHIVLRSNLRTVDTYVVCYQSYFKRVISFVKLGAMRAFHSGLSQLFNATWVV